MRIFVLLSCLLLVSCAGNFTTKHDNIIPSKKITWIISDNIERDCRMYGLTFNTITKVYGCAFWNDKYCKIITPKETSHEILGHELRHCFEGHFHD